MGLVLRVLLFLSAASTSFAVDYIAHRGFTVNAHENTLEAIAASWEFGADLVEVDLHVLRDGEVVLYHDPDVDGDKLADLEYAQLQRLVAEYHVPTLREAPKVVPSSRGIVLDLKSESTALVESLVREISLGAWNSEIIIQSSDLGLLTVLKSKLPEAISYQFLTDWNERVCS